MNEKIKQKWINALRSGKYKKGYAYLKKGDCYSVIGVLCDIAAEEGIGVWVETTYSYFLDNISKSVCTLPASVREWAELTDNEGYYDIYVNYGNGRTTISDLNDIKDLTFTQLADIIERSL